MIRFTQEVDGYAIGETVTLEPGVEDAYVTWRQAAEYVTPEEKALITTRPPADKMVHPPAEKVGKSRKGQLQVK